VLRVVEHAQRSDTGRQRQANEDSYFARAPLFAVADGMGGAQAGEVASRLAAEAFEAGRRREGQSPEAFLRQVARAANRRIHALAQRDVSRSGMGTTLTAILVDGDDVVIGHVGDSRAYRFRDGELELLTSDHSLVEELRRQGRLTDEQAEAHPQRSIITRALGPEPDVEVDTMTYRARPGDVYLLCSDGLTTMVKDDEIRAVLADAADLETAADELVRRANEAGGRDNITVVAFRVEEAPEGSDGDVEDDQLTMVVPPGRATGGREGAVRAHAKGSLGGAAARRPREAAASAERPRRRPLRIAAKLLVVAAVLAALVVAAVAGLRQVYFLGSDEAGRLALFRGLPYELPLGLDLYSEVESSPVQVTSLPPERRDAALNHQLRSRDDAVSLLEDLEAAALRAPSGRSREDEATGRSRKRSDGRTKRQQPSRGGGGGAESGRADRSRGERR
jgi:protein phosphatase